MKKRSLLHHFRFFTLQTVQTQIVPDFATSSTIRVPCHSRTLFGWAHLLYLPHHWKSFLTTSIINLIPFYKTMAQGHGGPAWLWSPFAETLFFFMASPLSRYLSSYINNFHHVKFMTATPAANCHRNTTQRPFSLKH